MQPACPHDTSPPEVPREGTPPAGTAQHGSGGPAARLAGLVTALRFHQFLRFLSVGAISTFADWGVFYVTAVRMGLHYQVGVACSWVLATVVHYTLNKFFTFRCRSRRILRQFALHACMSAIYLVLSMASMYALVDLLLLPAMAGKVITTGAMMVVSFTLARMVTFNPDFLR